MGNCASKRTKTRERLQAAEQQCLATSAAFAEQEEELLLTKDHLRTNQTEARSILDEQEARMQELDERCVLAEKANEEARGRLGRRQQDYEALQADFIRIQDQRNAASGATKRYRCRTLRLYSRIHRMREQIAHLESDAVTSKQKLQHQHVLYSDLFKLNTVVAAKAKTDFIARIESERASASSAWKLHLEEFDKYWELFDQLQSEKKRHKDTTKELEDTKKALTAGAECQRETLQQLEDAKASLTKVKTKLKAAKAASGASSSKSTADYCCNPVCFSRTDKILRIEFKDWQGETRIDIREWYSGCRSQKGVSIPVRDAAQLAKILPEVVRQAKR